MEAKLTELSVGYFADGKYVGGTNNIDFNILLPELINYAVKIEELPVKIQCDYPVGKLKITKTDRRSLSIKQKKYFSELIWENGSIRFYIEIEFVGLAGYLSGLSDPKYEDETFIYSEDDADLFGKNMIYS